MRVWHLRMRERFNVWKVVGGVKERDNDMERER